MPLPFFVPPYCRFPAYVDLQRPKRGGDLGCCSGRIDTCRLGGSTAAEVLHLSVLAGLFELIDLLVLDQEPADELGVEVAPMGL